jgi:hypothetical protein
MTCQMRCGACKREATSVLHAGGKMMDVLGLTTLAVRRVRAPRRDLVACDQHRPELERCAELYGGAIEPLTETVSRNRIARIYGHKEQTDDQSR